MTAEELILRYNEAVGRFMMILGIDLYNINRFTHIKLGPYCGFFVDNDTDYVLGSYQSRLDQATGLPRLVMCREVTFLAKLVRCGDGSIEIVKVEPEANQGEQS